MTEPTTPQPANVRALIAVCTASLLLSIVLALGLVLAGSRRALVLPVAFAALLVGVRWLVPRLYARRLPADWLLSLAVLNVILVGPELALRIAGFQHESGIQFGYPHPDQFRVLVRDRDLFWKHNRTDPGVNSWGFRTREVRGPSPGKTRILFLGDSCTEQGFPALAESLLNLRDPGRARPYEAIGLAVAGYTSFQGRKAAEIYGPRVKPDIVVVYFGWNDHWRAYGTTDSKKVVPPYAEAYDRLHHRSRMLQLLGYLARRSPRANSPLNEVRVPAREYADNLKAIDSVFAASAVPVIFVTAPTAYYKLGVPDYLVEAHFVADKPSGISLHREYNRIVRRVQGETANSVLLDLEEKYEALSADELRAIFLWDHIHFSDAGLMVVARDFSDAIVQALERGDTKPGAQGAPGSGTGPAPSRVR